MTVNSNQCLLPTGASAYAALVAALPEASSDTPGLQGGWCVTVGTEGKPSEEFDAIFVQGGQYCETGEQGSLEEGLGFGSWSSTDPAGGTFEVTSQKPLFEEAECTGWVQTVYSGLLGGPGSYSGSGHRTVFNLQGDEQGTVPLIVSARRSTFLVRAVR
jgi:hypothetical protein